MTTITEPLHWHDAATDKPEVMKTVLVLTGDTQEPFECAYWDGKGWISGATGGDLEGVKFWALPKGPRHG